MTPEKRIGHLLGVLLLLHFIGGLILPYVLLDSAIAPGVLPNAALHSATLRMVVATRRCCSQPPQWQ